MIRADGSEILGTVLPVLSVAHGQYSLKDWLIYSNGSARIGSQGELVPFEDTVRAFEDSHVVTNINSGVWLTIHNLGRFQVEDPRFPVINKERIREARDELSILQGNLGSIRECIARHHEYQQNPCDQTRERLREAYEAVPLHNQVFCGDMDSKDWPIRRILFGDEDERRRIL